MADQSVLDALTEKLFGPLGPEKFLDVTQRDARKKQAELPAAERRIGRLEKIASEEGLNAPPADSNFSVYKLLDAISTPKQMVQGAIAKGIGADGYSKLSLADAAKKGADEDIYAAKLMRRMPIIGTGDRAFGLPETLKGVVRGGLGFAADVATDPLSYFTFFSRGLGPQVGGLPLSEEAIRLTDGTTAKPFELYKKLLKSASSETASAINEIDDTLKAGYRNVDAGNQLKYFKASKAFNKAAAPFRNLNETLAAMKSQKGFGLDSLAAQDVQAQAAVSAARQSRLSQIADELGGVHVDDLNKIFKQRAIRFNSPFAGIPSFGKIPLLGAPELDIPFVSKVSEHLYQELSAAPYTMAAKFAKNVNNALGENPDSLFWNAAAKIGRGLNSGGELAAKTLGKVSRRIQASGSVLGARAADEAVKEHEVAVGALDMLSATESHYLLGNLPQDRPDIYNDITDTLQSGIQHMTTAKGDIAEKAADIMENRATFDEAVEGLRSKYNTAETPGLGDRVVESVQAVRNQFQKMFDIEKEAGLLNNSIRGYVHQMYESGFLDDIKDGPMKKRVMNLFGNGASADFTVERTFRTLKEAELMGLKPVKDIREIMRSRIFWHHRMMAEKDFAERMAYNFALPKSVHDEVQRLAVQGAKGIQEQASAVLDRYGTSDPHNLLFSLSGAKQTSRNGLVDGQVYDRWVSSAFGDNPVYKDLALKEIEQSAPILYAKLQQGLDRDSILNDVDILNERNTLDTKASALKASVKGLPGRDGEGPFTRAGAEPVSEVTRAKIRKLLDDGTIDHDTMQFYDGLLPKSLVEHIEDSSRGHDMLKAIERNLSAAGVRDPALDPIRRFAGAYKGHIKALKFGTTIMWPAYWVRNIMGAPFQGVHAMSQLGEAFNPLQMYKVYNVLKNNLAVETATGLLTGRELQTEMAQFGITGSLLNQVDLMHSYADQQAAILNTSESLQAIPALRRYMEKPAGKLQKTLGGIEAGFTGKSRMTDWAWEKLPRFGDRLEAFGRQHLYIMRRMRGDDPQSAANVVRRMMIDYQHGKTPFERNFLNNVFFFYSFSRGNLPTLFHSMMERPGMLSNSFSAAQSIAEMVSGSDDIDLDVDLGERLKSVRQREGLSFVVGKNKKTGLPVVISSTGLPVEDLGRFSALYLPTGSTWNDLVNAVGHSAKRSMQLAVSQANPWISGAYKVATGMDPFFDRPITDKKLRTIAGFERDMSRLAGHVLDKIPGDVMKTVDKELFSTLGAKDNGDGTYLVNPYTFMLLTHVVPGASRFINTRNSLSKPGQDSSVKAWRAFTGVNVQDQDLDTSAVFDRKKQLEDFLVERDIPTSLKAYRKFKATQERDDK